MFNVAPIGKVKDAMQFLPMFAAQFAEGSPIAGSGKDGQGYKWSETALYVKQVPLVKKTIKSIVKVENKMNNISARGKKLSVT